LKVFPSAVVISTAAATVEKRSSRTTSTLLRSFKTSGSRTQASLN